MIIKGYEGRARSFRSRAEDNELLQKEFDALDEDEKQLLLYYWDEVGKKDVDFIPKIITEAQFKTKPVSMEQFLEDPFYLGESCRTLYPKLKKDLITLFSNNYNEVVLTGSLGYGKTTFASIAVSRLLYELSCYNCPQDAFGIAQSSKIIIALFSKKKLLARRVLKAAVDERIRLSEYFRKNFLISITQDFTRFANNIELQTSSYNTPDDVLGGDVYIAVMDEANFSVSKKQQVETIHGEKRKLHHYDVVDKIYKGLLRRIKSRFVKAGGFIPGMVILLSSAATVGSFLERRIAESKDDPTIFVRDYATWHVKPSKNFSGKTFRILCGSPSLRSKILEENEEIDDVTLEENEAVIIEVPDEYRPDFETDLEGAIRDIGGISTHAMSVFIHRKEMIKKCIVARPHPFTVTEWQFGTPGNFMWDKLCRKMVRRLTGGYEEEFWVPIINPRVQRHIHIDAALTGDSLGFCMGHIDRWVDVIRRSPSGEQYADVAPYIIIDFMLSVIPPSGEQIFLPDIISMVYDLQLHGFGIMGLSTDLYQHAAIQQPVSKKGVNTYLLSVDTSTEPYDALKTCIYEQRIEYYNYPPFIRELNALEIDREKNKVEHPKDNSKDVADSCAGVVAGLIRDSKRLPVDFPDDSVEDRADDYSWVTGSRLVPAKTSGSREDRDIDINVDSHRRDLLLSMLGGDD